MSKATCYLGQHYSLKEKNQDKEIQRRIMAGWAAYAKHWDIFKSNLAICLKRQVYNSCVLPAMTYGAETWALTKQPQNKLAAAQTKTEISKLNITYKDRKSNIWVRERTIVIDIINTVRRMKWFWAGHINRLKDDRWTSRVTTWRPYDQNRRQGRPAKRWRDDLEKYLSDTIWQRTAQDMLIWRRHAEAFAQPRTQRLPNDDDDEPIRWLKQPLSSQPIILVVEQPMWLVSGHQTLVKITNIGSTNGIGCRATNGVGQQ